MELILYERVPLSDAPAKYAAVSLRVLRSSSPDVTQLLVGGSFTAG